MSLFLSYSTPSTAISSSNFIYASGLLKCFGLAVVGKKFRDLNQGNPSAVSPPEIKQLSARVMPKVAVMTYLYLKCELIFLVPFSVLVGLKTGE